MRVLILLLATLAAVSAYTDYCQNAANSSWPISTNPALVIWTYDAFEQGTAESDMFGPYATANGINLTDIIVCRKQSNALVDAIRSIPANFAAPNVVMGLDNVLEFLAPQSNFTDFNTPRSADMVPVVNTLGHFQHMKPFDYGLVGVYFDITQNPELYHAETNQTFNLPWFVNSGLIHKFVAISPIRDTAGLAFLMWTIAELGDPQLNITGKINYNGGWRSWWTSAFKQNMTVADTWTGAFSIFESDANLVNMMSSYGSSPAYDWCMSNSSNTRAITSWYNNARFGWAQVEAVALLRNNTAAWNFIDYVLSPPFQSQLPLGNYMNPVNSKATIPQCYSSTVIAPTQVTLLNPYIATVTLASSLQSILNDWKSLYTQYYSSNITIPNPTNPPTNAPTSSSSTGPSTGLSSSSSSSSFSFSSSSFSSSTGATGSSTGGKVEGIAFTVQPMMMTMVVLGMIVLIM